MFQMRCPRQDIPSKTAADYIGTVGNRIPLAYLLVGVREEEEENLQEKVLTIFKEKLNLQGMCENDIDLYYRFGHAVQSKVRDVVVRFQSREKRNLVYRCRRNMPRDDPPIYINEDLTLIRSKLFYDARRMKKTGKVSSVWTQEGNVVLKINDSSELLQIRTHDDLRDVREQLNNSENYKQSNYIDSDSPESGTNEDTDLDDN